MDAATLMLGRWIENQLAEHDDKGKPLHTLEELLGNTAPGTDARPVKQYASLRGLVARTVRIDESGVWDVDV